MMKARAASHRWSVLLLGAVLLIGAQTAGAANIVLQDVGVEDYPTVSIDVALTADLVPETGAPRFVVLENGIEAQDVRAESAAVDSPPIDVVLLLDTSGSMRGAPLEAAKAAAKGFVESLRPEDRVAVVAFSSSPRRVLQFTSDAQAVATAIDGLGAEGETALYDGLIEASKVFEEGERERYITVLSDGGDTTSINGIDVASRAVESAGAPVYAVALESPEYDPAALERLATSSGGRLVAAQDVGSLAASFEDIARELRNLYTISFTSSRPSTKDLSLELRAINGELVGSMVTAVPNPRFEEGALPPERLTGSPSPASWGTIALVGSLTLVSVMLSVWALGSMLAPRPAALEQLHYYDQYEEEDGLDHESMKDHPTLGRVIGAVSYVAERRGFTGQLRTMLERANLPLRPNEYIFFHVLVSALVGWITLILTGSLLLAIALVIAVVVGPIVWLGVRIDKRRQRFEEQLPDVLSLIAGSLRAGWGIQQAIELVVDEVADPSATEFRRVQSETRFGLPFEDALRRMADRLDSEDFRWTVTAVAIQREVGGNLAEVLDIVANTIRVRAELKRQVQALSAEGRFSAIALSFMPFLVVAILFVVHPRYIGVLFSSPTAITILVVGAALLVVGVVWINRITKVEV